MRSPINVHCRQRGSVLITTAIALSLIVICLIGIELGYLFFMKRELQKTADLAALAGAKIISGTNCADAKISALENANDAATGNMPQGMEPLTVSEVICGTWTALGQAGSPANRFTAASNNLNAVQVSMSRAPISLLPFFTANRMIAATATAATLLPRASLNIRSTLISVDTGKSLILNSVFSGLLGGNVALDAAGWNGLLNTNVQLLNYLDQLAIKLNVAAGKYDELLSTKTSVGNLIDAMASALKAGGSGDSTNISISALEAIAAAARIPSNQPSISLGEILKLQSGTSSAGLDLALQAFQLVQGVVQAANWKNAATASVPVKINGLDVNLMTKIVEPPQFSVIGNPELAKANPLGENKIYVRTASVRTLLSVSLGKTGQTLYNITSGLTTALSNLTSVVGGLVRSIVNLDAPSNCAPIGLFCTSPPKPVVKDATPLPLPIRIDVNVDLASAEAHVTDFDCTNLENKTLSADSSTSIATVRIGNMGASENDARINVFSSLQAPPKVSPIPILDIGTAQARSSCLLNVLGASLLCNVEYLQLDGSWKSGTAGLASSVRTAFGGGGLGIFATPAPSVSEKLPLAFRSANPGQLLDIDNKDETQTFLSFSASNTAASSITSNLTGVKIDFYSPNPSTGLLGSVLATADLAVTAVFDIVQPLIRNLMSMVVDPLVSLLLDGLGIDLGAVKVGGRLSCMKGAELVY